jgi:hypothetical protein
MLAAAPHDPRLQLEDIFSYWKLGICRSLASA